MKKLPFLALVLQELQEVCNTCKAHMCPLECGYAVALVGLLVAFVLRGEE